MLRVALDLGVAKYGAAPNNTPSLPTDPATLYKLTDFVNGGRAEFYADFPDAQFRRRVIELAIGPDATDYQVPGDSSSYLLPVDWLGPPQGKIVVTGGRGGWCVLTSMERVRLAFAQSGQATSPSLGRPELMACEPQSTPQVGEEARYLLRVYPRPDQAYTLDLRGRWRATKFDQGDVEPTGQAEAIVAYATNYAVSKGLIVTGVKAADAFAAKEMWRLRTVQEEALKAPRSIGRSQRPRQQSQMNQAPIRATNPWNP